MPTIFSSFFKCYLSVFILSSPVEARIHSGGQIITFYLAFSDSLGQRFHTHDKPAIVSFFKKRKVSGGLCSTKKYIRGLCPACWHTAPEPPGNPAIFHQGFLPLVVLRAGGPGCVHCSPQLPPWQWARMCQFTV